MDSDLVGQIVLGVVFGGVNLLGLVAMFFPIAKAYAGYQLYTAKWYGKAAAVLGTVGFWVYVAKLINAEVEFGMGTGFLLVGLLGGGFGIAAATGEYRE